MRVGRPSVHPRGSSALIPGRRGPEPPSLERMLRRFALEQEREGGRMLPDRRGLPLL